LNPGEADKEERREKMAEKNEIIQPQHKICNFNVDMPTVFPDDEIDRTDASCPKWKSKAINIQWFGQANVQLPEKSQFLFPVLADPKGIEWMGHPETFRVVFLDQVKNWPKPENALITAKTVAKGDMEAWIVWLVSSFIGIRHSDGVGPASYAMPIVLLADGDCGIITPQPYTNMRALAEENQKIASRQQIPF